MSIIVIDQSPELFWFVSNSLIADEIPLKHFKTAGTGEKFILQELPEIVIVNGDDKSLEPEKFINRMRNHVFARHILFIVVTSDMSVNYKKNLLIAGAGQVLYRGIGFSPSAKFFNSIVKWFQTKNDPDPQIFDYSAVPFTADADFTSYGRLGWLSSTHCMIETNIDLNPGQKIELKNALFSELAIENLQLECVEKNKAGRYYQYSNSLMCKIISKDPPRDADKINSWIGKNKNISKHKPIKLIYFESDPNYREVIKNVVKEDKRYCVRGFSTLDDIENILETQLPHLILIDRAMIEKDKTKFDIIKNFVKANLCYCITYALQDNPNIEEFKKDYDFALHSLNPIDISLLESMLVKLEIKLPPNQKTDPWKVYFNKHSEYSRVTLHSQCMIKELALNGASIILPFSINNFCACEIGCNAFTNADMNRVQFFRCFNSKKLASGPIHRLIFMGQNTKDNENLKVTIEKITEFGYDKWLVGDTTSNKTDIKN